MLFRRHAERLGFTDAQIRDGWAKLTSDPNIEKARIRLHFELGSPGSKPSGMRWQARPAVMRLLDLTLPYNPPPEAPVSLVSSWEVFSSLHRAVRRALVSRTALV